MSDKYDDAVAYLTEHPEQIIEAWQTPTKGTSTPAAAAHCLFMYATPSGDEVDNPDKRLCGCLTQIRGSVLSVAWTPELTKAIRSDKRIPADARHIGPKDLPVFAEWQRKIDQALNRD